MQDYCPAILAGCLVLTASGQTPPVKTIKVDKNIFLELEGAKGEKRRVVIEAYVCLRQGLLEQLLTRKRTKEHEAILAADIDARAVHAALIAAGAEPGKPMQFRPKVVPPSGTIIKITLEYKDKEGKLVRVPAQQWVRHIKSRKDLKYDWVFGGSTLFFDPEDKKKPPFYGANDGDVICVANFETAMLDLPVDSTTDNEDLAFEAHTDRIPPLQTPVRIILEPVLKKKN